MNNVPCTLDILRVAFPRKPGNCARTGYIPIDFFNQNEKEIRKMMKHENLRAIYRGPRLSNELYYSTSIPSMTRRCDATHVVLYLK